MFATPEGALRALRGFASTCRRPGGVGARWVCEPALVREPPTADRPLAWSRPCDQPVSQFRHRDRKHAPGGVRGLPVPDPRPVHATPDAGASRGRLRPRRARERDHGRKSVGNAPVHRVDNRTNGRNATVSRGVPPANAGTPGPLARAPAEDALDGSATRLVIERGGLVRHTLGKLLGGRGSVPIGTGRAGVAPSSRAHIMRRVVALRGGPAWGKGKIAAFLCRRGIGVSAAVVGRAFARLSRDGEVEPIRGGEILPGPASPGGSADLTSRRPSRPASGKSAARSSGSATCGPTSRSAGAPPRRAARGELPRPFRRGRLRAIGRARSAIRPAPPCGRAAPGGGRVA